MNLKRRLANTAIVAGAFALPLFVYGIPEADAVNGCTSQVVTKVSRWQHKTGYGEIVADPRPHTEGRNVYLNVNSFYWYCPNGTGPNKMKVKYYEACWFLPDRGDKPTNDFDGVRFNIYYYDSNGIAVNMPTHKVVDDGTRSNCDVVSVADTAERWMYFEADPRWNVWSEVVRDHGLWDEGEENWDAGDKPTKYFNPGNDDSVSPWFSRVREAE